ncbi:uncharacterized protein SAPINGB_P005811 [Magnusiomyces paraingens]|uniref:Chitin biosynthesis protein CHS5 n=1 Tax=Magnusiomyces paraingens TaxID=2606893 RepID=A0A5E8C3S0_9ASCO|nr:uncharacterized protein SAPINGB_P005811 [Saprochaete ingens]VVT57670.1 unnamed protein product [Saprochaete ingens]
MVEVSLTVGKLDASLALLLTKEHHLIEFPTILLPPDVEAGSIVKISCERDHDMEEIDNKKFNSIQDELYATFGTKYPQTPQLRVRNVTQTSVVLEWDPIDIATTDILSLTLYKNGSRFGVIPTPLKRTATKLSGLAIDTSYSFYLVLATTGGTFKSEELTVKTHKMTDLTGITICVGNMDGTEITRSDLEETVKKIGAKPLQDTVKLDTTHFICTVGEGPHWKRAQDLNIPIVRPEWIEACEAERRLVGVRAYYLNADPKLRPPVKRPRASSYGETSLANASAPDSGATTNGSLSATSSAGPSNPSDPSINNSGEAKTTLANSLPPVNTSGHRRTVSEIQDSPISTPVATTPSIEPLAEEPEAEAEAENASTELESTTPSQTPPLPSPSHDKEAEPSSQKDEDGKPETNGITPTPTIEVTPPEEHKEEINKEINKEEKEEEKEEIKKDNDEESELDNVALDSETTTLATTNTATKKPDDELEDDALEDDSLEAEASISNDTSRIKKDDEQEEAKDTTAVVPESESSGDLAEKLEENSTGDGEDKKDDFEEVQLGDENKD